LIADREYRAGPIPLSVHLFSAQENAHADIRRGWDQVLPLNQIHVVPVPGNHLSMVTKPHVALLGAALSRAIRLLKNAD
jgi:arthrofactin-type cyclic lipopeptide synthetase C